ncbi:IS3 family transposase [Listeria welshimeri]|nr:IS3 family transposase [Listeria welshimeri]
MLKQEMDSGAIYISFEQLDQAINDLIKNTNQISLVGIRPNIFYLSP